ncbi:MAG: trypsin-like peptidase domain-containing protein [Planctomycetota bacterium]
MERRDACLVGFLCVGAATFLVLAVGAVFWLSVRADDVRDRSGSGTEPLAPGAPRESSIVLAESHERIFAVAVPERTVALHLRLSSRDTELLLQAAIDGKDGADEPAWDFSRATDAGRTELTIGRFSDPPIQPGRLRVRVAWTSDYLPRTTERRIDRIPFTLEATVVAARTDGVLEPGVAAASAIEAESGGFRSFRIEVPSGSRALRVDLLDVSSDLDLYARHGEPVLSLEGEVLFAQHFYGRETLLVGGAGTPPEAGTWHVDVVGLLEEEGPAPFKILATLAEEPPAELLAIPPIPPALGAAPVARALAAVVEITTDDGVGSGTILTPDGWILTNAHVVEAIGGGSCEEVVVSASMDPRRPPVEMFRARVEVVDDARDLALVRIATGFYGQPLPAGYLFPTVEMGVGIGDPALPAIGVPIWLVGYPSTGGQGSRVSITCTSGVVSGYDTAPFGPLIKTDAEITDGNSGGAAIDEQGRILGVATSLVESGSGQVAYVHPLAAMPVAWRELLTGVGRR